MWYQHVDVCLALVALLAYARASQTPIQLNDRLSGIVDNHEAHIADKDSFLDSLIANMTIEDLSMFHTA